MKIFPGPVKRIWINNKKKYKYIYVFAIKSKKLKGIALHREVLMQKRRSFNFVNFLFLHQFLTGAFKSTSSHLMKRSHSETRMCSRADLIVCSVHLAVNSCEGKVSTLFSRLWPKICLYRRNSWLAKNLKETATLRF